ncbi:hypothetical protein [Vibrio parahaemolyticus]|nr:hypothetical protein [Vibrio parahaemolyticus]
MSTNLHWTSASGLDRDDELNGEKNDQIGDDLILSFWWNDFIKQ